MSQPLERILDRLDGVRQSGRSHMAKCPAHDDRSPSLRVTTADDGRVLLYCLAGCSTAKVIAAMGLNFSDLFQPRTEAEKREYQRAALQRALDFEQLLLKIAANSLDPMSTADRARVALAQQRITKITAELGNSHG